MRPVRTSLFELFTIGPGPSSSHTIGPMRAARDFLELCRALPHKEKRRAKSLEVRLYGSLSATGRGHGADRAVLAGLLGHAPESCPPDLLSDLGREPEMEHRVLLSDDPAGPGVDFAAESVIFDAVDHRGAFSNTLTLALRAGRAVLARRAYYSIGGGSIVVEGQEEPARGEPAFPYSTMRELREQCRTHRKPLSDLLVANERAVYGTGEDAVRAGLDRVMAAMCASVQRGVAQSGVLPGPIGLHRKAKALYTRSLRLAARDRFLLALNAYAVAAAEENAAGGAIVTAPTAGACGVVAGCLYLMQVDLRLPRHRLRAGLAAAAAVGLLARHNASVSGAEVGCQGEVGVASAMAAAMLTFAHGHRLRIAANAAETALEHHLGLTCDPVAGYVQIPCIERNAMGAVKAYNAYLIAASEVSAHHKVDLDHAIAAMYATGKDMDRRYKETAQAGLAVTLAEC